MLRSVALNTANLCHKEQQQLLLHHFKRCLQTDVVDGSKFHDSHMGATKLNIPAEVQIVLSTHWTLFVHMSDCYVTVESRLP